VYLLRTPEAEGAWCLPAGPGRAEIQIARPGLAPGVYYANSFAWDPLVTHCLHYRPGWPFLIQGPRDSWAGPVRAPEHEWTKL
jgi:hypothetical protein